MRDEQLIVWSESPLNAETPAHLLCRSAVTPAELLFIRNHGSMPTVAPDAYRLTVDGDVRTALVLSLRELRERFPPATVTATIACAGNRRSELRPRPEGIPWGAGAIGTAAWTGARLRDVLAAAGVEPEARHVAFTGLDDVDGEGFGGSIPLEKALAPEVLLVYELNGAPLTTEHGFPVRVVVPGWIGARSVKWLSAVSVQREPSASFFQRTDYTLDGVQLGELALNAAVCAVEPGATAVRVEGYAIGAGGRDVERVELSGDGGRTWRPATLSAGGSWSWWLWHGEIDATSEVVVRAHDSSGGQPADLGAAWNARGYMNNAWHRMAVRR